MYACLPIFRIDWTTSLRGRLDSTVYDEKNDKCDVNVADSNIPSTMRCMFRSQLLIKIAQQISGVKACE